MVLNKFKCLYPVDHKFNYALLDVTLHKTDSLVTLGNFFTAIALFVGTLLQKLVFGELRPVEIEHLFLQKWQLFTPDIICGYSWGSYNEKPIHIWLLYWRLVCSKVLHWIMCDRLNVLIQEYHQKSDGKFWKLLYNRVVIMLTFFVLADITSIKSYYNEALQRESPIQLRFSFETFMLFSELLYRVVKYGLDICEIHYRQKYSKEAWASKVWIQSIMKTVTELSKCIIIFRFLISSHSIHSFHYKMLEGFIHSVLNFKNSAHEIHRLIINTI